MGNLKKVSNYWAKKGLATMEDIEEYQRKKRIAVATKANRKYKIKKNKERYADEVMAMLPDELNEEEKKEFIDELFSNFGLRKREKLKEK